MNIFRVFDKIKKKNSGLILYCILNRIPIFVFGDKVKKVDKFLIELSRLIHFRKEIVFYTDFISLAEYDNLMQNEEVDFNTQRVQIRCPANVALKALNQFESFDSFIVGFEIPRQKDNFLYLKNQIRKKASQFLNIIISSNTITVDLEGINSKLIDLTLEDNIFQKISQDTEKAIVRMKRVLSEKIHTLKIEKDIVNSLLDFNVEKEELKRNIFKKEIQNFYSGCKRAFFILSRLNLLNTIEISTTIGSNTLLETIDYLDAPIDRILFFINREWGETFSDLLESNKKTFIVDKIQSLWG
jgi:hypothetical protein